MPVSPFQGLVLVLSFTQGGAARLTTLRSALGWCVEALQANNSAPKAWQVGGRSPKGR